MNTTRPEVIQRLAELEEQRKEERQRKRVIEEDARNPNESTEAFLEKFSGKVDGIRGEVEELKGTPEEVRRRGEELLVELNGLDDEVSQAAFYLPPFDVRQSRISVAELRKKVEEVRSALAPKKKFTFSKKTGAGKGPSTHKPTMTDSTERPTTSLNLTQKMLEGKVGEDLKMKEADLGSRGFTVSNCTDCKIQLEGTLLALQLRDLTNCTVVILGHVKGATMMFHLHDCSVYLASAQVRIHNSVRTSLCLRVRSNPIIEDSTEMKFGPLKSDDLSPWLPEEEKRILDAGGDALCEENGLWAKVHDFNWLQETPSPNWSALDAVTTEEQETVIS